MCGQFDRRVATKRKCPSGTALKRKGRCLSSCTLCGKARCKKWLQIVPQIPLLVVYAHAAERLRGQRKADTEREREKKKTTSGKDVDDHRKEMLTSSAKFGRQLSLPSTVRSAVQSIVQKLLIYLQSIHICGTTYIPV